MEPESGNINNVYALAYASLVALAAYLRTRVERSATASTRDAAEENTRMRLEALEKSLSVNCASKDDIKLLSLRLDQSDKIQESLVSITNRTATALGDIKSDLSYLKGGMDQMVREKDLA